MRLAVALLLTLPTLAACGEGEKAAPEASTAPATAAPAEVAPVATAAAPANLEAACRDMVNRMYGQEGDAVVFTATGERTAQVSWRAPVDGGRLEFECRAEADGADLFRDGQRMSVDVQMAAPAAKQEAR
ncbi:MULTISPECIES: hypothetical protein [unclassified Brevundimonas]|jgi:hypothetical protein|uniref:hypothetical protein n=1 Tax=unclassified Brevundimonas TaxID=2622653 RepID=UPI00129DF148|nr:MULTISPECIES: hypothetical protein [unclassified Brevundimonas]MRL67980.1 hypothetical protein [Brevundimonas sp. SPF441]QIF81740.1 hypothetical protein E4341_08525 [Brevundimonas sp. 'scallop']